jgi:hypothetical protein
MTSFRDPDRRDLRTGSLDPLVDHTSPFCRGARRSNHEARRFVLLQSATARFAPPSLPRGGSVLRCGCTHCFGPLPWGRPCRHARDRWELLRAVVLAGLLLYPEPVMRRGRHRGLPVSGYGMFGRELRAVQRDGPRQCLQLVVFGHLQWAGYPHSLVRCEGRGLRCRGLRPDVRVGLVQFVLVRLREQCERERVRVRSLL